uniref:Glutaredoxin domain-containing protein n=1 Tax=Pinguiococcus pyrenoidosus TaxID=172671 RepID=A0A6U0VCI6_9STRA|mmetsp:Transcript_276/g.1147  ORF Transcript_276/g.1147 Transcript_276/m.1147 type:complete len:160 (+) Transcript_276:159-638(+)
MSLRRTLLATSAVTLGMSSHAFLRPAAGMGTRFAGMIPRRMAAQETGAMRMSSSMADRVQENINSAPVFMYTFSTCPFCIKAKTLLDSLDAQYTEVQLDKLDEGNQIREEMRSLIGRTSVPAIWIKGEFVGGANDGPGVFPLHQQGKLVPLLKDAGAVA